ncbi:Transcriptional adapter ada2 [Dimargaris xerosporica]|nr:Transcriptional adapter ada2 [Dimargaris xerosporica]
MAEDRAWRYHCDCCQSVINRTVRIRCAECSDFDACVSCFSKGIEIGDHKNYHKYKVVTPNFFPIYTEDWSADEELLLIEGIQQAGLGNWIDVSEHVGTKGKDECERHYRQVYLESLQWPLPAFLESTFDSNKAATRPPAAKKLRPSPSNPRQNKPLSSGPANHEVQGYMPARLEFEVEHENEAEHCVKDMVFNPDDTTEDTELKLVTMDIYNHKIDRRLERKRFILERNLVDYKRIQATEKKRTKEERDLWNRCKTFAKLHTREDHDDFVRGLVREQQLRSQIAALQEYRRGGITTLKEGEQYEQAKQNRIQAIRINGLRDIHHKSNHNRHALPAPQFDTNITSSIKPPPGATTFQIRSRPTAPSPAAASAVPAAPSTPKKSASMINAAATGSRKPANPLDLDNVEGVHLLSPEEQQLCSVLRILPRPYLVIKETILKEYAKRGSLRRRETRELIKIDVNKTSRIYDFFLSMGWITAPGRTAFQWQKQQRPGPPPSSALHH